MSKFNKKYIKKYDGKLKTVEINLALYEDKTLKIDMDLGTPEQIVLALSGLIFSISHSILESDILDNPVSQKDIAFSLLSMLEDNLKDSYSDNN